MGGMLARNRTLLVGNIVTLIATAAIGVATLTPATTSAIEPRWACVVCGTTGVADVLVNLLLYVPYGVGLTMLGMRPTRALALVLATTFAVELLQYRVLVGRDGTLSDVLTNTLGGTSGIVVARHWRSLALPTPRSSALLAAGWAVVWAGVLAISAYALAPTADTAGAVVWWKPVMPPFQQFQGALDAVVVDGRSTVNREILPPPSPSESVSVAIRVAAEPTRVASAPIVWIGHGDSEDVVLLRARHDLVARFKVRGSAWRLVSPTFLLPGAFGSREPRQVRATMAGHVLTLTAAAPNASQARSITLGPTLGWALLVPSFVRVGPRYHWYSLAWMTVFLFPLGYWAGRGALARGAVAPLDAASAGIAVGSLVMAFAALGIVAVMMTETRPVWWEWAGAGAAVLAGATAAMVVR
jgi:hypothetical protein